jgi:hypothetical protein
MALALVPFWIRATVITLRLDIICTIIRLRLFVIVRGRSILTILMVAEVVRGWMVAHLRSAVTVRSVRVARHITKTSLVVVARVREATVEAVVVWTTHVRSFLERIVGVPVRNVSLVIWNSTHITLLFEECRASKIVSTLTSVRL